MESLGILYERIQIYNSCDNRKQFVRCIEDPNNNKQLIPIERFIIRYNKDKTKDLIVREYLNSDLFYKYMLFKYFYK